MKAEPILYQKLLEMVRRTDSENTNEVSSKVARDFRLSRDDVKKALKEFEGDGKLEIGSKGKLTFTDT